ncbi:acyl transferase [Photobacterium phosphoreum]|jgi:acyl transferase|uniref:Acyl transferase n=1 Tax=Photobacterium phosphoreum TaxID=659 RepID=A7MAT4_PHOPO|nr:activated long-chain acyl hydrolase LuxD [Photobacterium phosphoreum]ABU50699.1 myristoyl transferase [Photobacterium phosphoreum]MCD9462033.1 acyl transferase [Photobacterium phosphoreum]MCD9478951.1 activated long-chain acyl hydrolase LuxD [Photobacterium phosphoreum]MCD9506301.1 activated long-chain acyl hydrolase LuxD [Photobacterium phosphoreum]MCD9510695.1 activated long-chain acyl hydrolase LuxD [Photobacterium phosphoreum]
MKSENNSVPIDHVIKVNNDQYIRVWETIPKNQDDKRNNTIVIASGFARRMDHFAGLAEYLSTNGFHVIRYDSLNHVGLSSGEIDQFSMSVGKKSLLTVIDWLKSEHGIDQIGLIASSLSARIAYDIVADVNLSFLITAVGVVNLRNTLEQALKYDYLKMEIDEIPEDLNFDGYNLGSKVFVTDCFENNWDTLDSTINKTKNLNFPFIAFVANDDSWVQQHEVEELMNNINSDKTKIYSLIGSSHDLGENLIVLRNFYQSITKAAIALDSNLLGLASEIVEPQFEALTIATVNERRLKNTIKSKSLV